MKTLCVFVLFTLMILGCDTVVMVEDEVSSDTAENRGSSSEPESSSSQKGSSDENEESSVISSESSAPSQGRESSSSSDDSSENTEESSSATVTSEEYFSSEEYSSQEQSSQEETELSSSTVAEINQAHLTWYTSYPDPGSEECIVYNGCTWAGYFAGVEGKMPEDWVEEHNIAAVHEKDFDTYKNKTLRLTQGANEIDVVVYDMCSDSDCDGCCTKNVGELGFLIDVESYTAERFGVNSGVVDWQCIDCK